MEVISRLLLAVFAHVFLEIFTFMQAIFGLIGMYVNGLILGTPILNCLFPVQLLLMCEFDVTADKSVTVNRGKTIFLPMRNISIAVSEICLKNSEKREE